MSVCLLVYLENCVPNFTKCFILVAVVQYVPQIKSTQFCFLFVWSHTAVFTEF